MKKLFIGLTILSSMSLFATEINASNIVGTYEAVVLEPTLDKICSAMNIETYIVQYDLKADGTLSYREYHNHDRTEGILGTENVPACTGTYSIENGMLNTTTDCSLYSEVYHQEISLDQVTLESVKSKDGLVVESTSTQIPGEVFKSVLRKM